MNVRGVDEHPPLPTLSPSRGERAFLSPRHCERSEATLGTDAKEGGLKRPPTGVPRAGGDPAPFAQAESDPLVALFSYSSSATISTMGSGLRSVSKIIRKR